MKQPLIWVSGIGLEDKKAFVAHENGNWGPENADSDYLKHPLKLCSAMNLVCYANFLKRGEEFKIVVPVSGEKEARLIFTKRMKEDVHISERFDFDATHNTLWLLDSNYPVFRPMKWNQNNVFLHSL